MFICQVKFEPPLPSWKRNAIQAMACGHCHKTVLDLRFLTLTLIPTLTLSPPEPNPDPDAKVLSFDECFWEPEMRAATVTTDVPGEAFAFHSHTPKRNQTLLSSHVLASFLIVRRRILVVHKSVFLCGSAQARG